jgi:prepilin peptidase CpaA
VTPLDDGLLAFTVVWAVVTDLRSRRISNRLTVPVMALGLAIGGLLGGWGGLTTSISGLLFGAALLLLPAAVGALGGGDLKLLAAVGALKGPYFVLLAAVYAGLAGGVVAVIALVRARGLKATLRYLAFGWRGSAQGPAPKPGSIPYAPAIAAGVVVAWLYPSLGAA